MLKKIFTLAACALLLIVLPSCSLTTSTSATGYRNDITSEEAVNRLTAVIKSPNGYKTVDKDYISRMNFGDGYAVLEQNLTDWCIVTSARTESNADIIGVLHVNDPSKVELVEDVVENFVEAQKARMSLLYSAYAPSEVPKIENADTERYGNYILFTFLDENQSDIAEIEFKDILKR